MATVERTPSEKERSTAPEQRQVVNDRVPEPTDDDALDLRGLLLPFWRRKWLIMLLAALGILAAIPVALSIDRTYTASARVIFEPERLRIIDLDSVVVQSEGSTVGIQNQIEILRSSILLHRVIDTLRLERTPELNPELSAGPPSPLERALVSLPLPARATDYLTELGLITPRIPESLTPEERAEELRTRTLNELRASLRLRPIPNSRVIEISFTSTNPRLAAAIANAVAEQYIVLQTEQKRDEIAAASELLSGRVRDLENRLNLAEEALRTAQLELSIGAEHGSSYISRQIESVTTALQSAEHDLASIRARYAEAARALELGDDFHLVPDFRASAVLQGYRAREVELMDQEASLRAIVASTNNPTLMRLEARLGEVQRNISAEAERIVASLARDAAAAEAAVEQLQATVSELDQRAAEQSRAELRVGRLEREANASRAIYETFLTRMQQTSEQASIQAPDARFLTRATIPQIPESASRQQMVLMGGLGGAALAIGLIFLLERLNDSFRRSSDVEARTGLPVLGGMPMVGRRRKPRQLLAEVLANPSGALAESVRNLRTSILFSNIDQSPKVIMFASAVPMEGKTTTAMLSAVMSQQMERSAIIVDCDLRRRAMSSIFPISDDQPGLFSALQGHCSLTEAVYVEPETGLHVLAPEKSRRGLGNPADILASRSFQRLIGQLKARYDLVILDTPPSLIVTDARIVAQLADTVIYLVRWDSTRRSTVLEGLKELSSVRARISGICLTSVNQRVASRYFGNEHFYKRSYSKYVT